MSQESHPPNSTSVPRRVDSSFAIDTTTNTPSLPPSNHQTNHVEPSTGTSFVLSPTPGFLDILFAIRHSLSTNAFAVSVFMDAFNFVQFVGIIVVLYLAQNDTCDIPLRSLLYFYGCRIMFSLLLSIFFHINRRYQLVGPMTIRILDFFRLGVDFLTIAIIVCGNYLVFIRNTCQMSSPILFYTSFGIIVINYLTIAFPIFLMITLLMSGRFRSFPGDSPLQLEAGAPPEALEKTKLVRVRHNLINRSKTPTPLPLPDPLTTDLPTTPDLDPDQKQPLSPSISIFTTVSLHGTSVLMVPPGSQQECSICLCPLEENDLVRRLTCRHHYHSDCIDRWLANHPTCPLCKHDLNTDLSPPSSETTLTPRPTPTTFPRASFLSLHPRHH